MLASRNYAPSPELNPYVRRYYVFDADLPDDAVIEDSLLAENAFIRVVMKGDWQVETQSGQWVNPGRALLFGSNSQPLKVRVKGPFRVVGFAIRPSAWRSLFKDSATLYVNRMAPLQESWGSLADDLLREIEKAKTDDAVVAAMERAVTAQLAIVKRNKVDKEIAHFEMIARNDSTIRMEEVSRHIGLSVRQLERRCLSSYGISPKAILRRSRFLDMAEAMRGFSSPGDEILATLRYFDQSHLNREFRHFSGMTPGKFAKATTPLFTAGLKLRVEGKGIA